MFLTSHFSFVPVYQCVFRRVAVPVSAAFRPRSGRVSPASGTQNSPFLNELSAYFDCVSLVCKTRLFVRVFTAETRRRRGKEGAKNRKPIPDARVFRIKGTLPNGHVSTRFPPRLCDSAVKLLAYFQRAPETSEPNGPRAMRLTQIVGFPDTKVRDTLNFPLLA